MKLNIFYIFPIFFLLAYFPLITLNFVPQDQLRIFNYNDIDSVSRFLKCSSDTMGGMFLTGRPLVWISECLEHSLITDIEQIKYYRIPNLIVMTLTFFVSFKLLKKFSSLTELENILFNFILFFLPGYTFMFVQGLTSLGVILSVLASVSSLYFLEMYFREEKSLENKNKFLIFSIILFFYSLLNYPIFAFIIFNYICVISIFKNYKNKKKIFEFFKRIIFYSLIIFTYFVLISIFNTFYDFDMGIYDFSFNSLENIYFKIIHFVKKIIFNDIFINFQIKNILIIFFLLLLIYIFLNFERIAYSKIFSVICLLIITIFISVIPSLFSHFNSIPLRHMLAFHHLFSFLIVYLFIFVIKKYLTNSKKKFSFLLIFCLAISANHFFICKKLVVENQFEFRVFETILDSNIDIEKLINSGQHFHFIRSDLSSFINKSAMFNSGEFSPSTTQNPSHIKEVFKIELKKNVNSKIFKKITFRDCRLNINCGIEKSKPYEIIITQSEDEKFFFPKNANIIIIDFDDYIKSFEFSY